MTENHPEPEQIGVDGYDPEFIPAPAGEQGDGELEPGDDSGNPYAGLTPAQIEAEQGGDDA